MGCAASSQVAGLDYSNKRGAAGARYWSSGRRDEKTLRFLLVGDDETGSSTKTWIQQVEDGLLTQYPGTQIEHDEMNESDWGSQQTTFRLNATEFELIDVTGVRSNERQWMESFSRVDAVVFAVSLSGFDECITVNGRPTNRMMEALERFRLLSNSKTFINKPFLIFFFDKEDFVGKLEKTPRLSKYEIFQSFRGEAGDFQSTVLHIGKQFEACSAASGLLRETFMHLVDKPDSTVEAFLDQARTICMASELVRSGFIKLDRVQDNQDGEDEDPTCALSSQGGSNRSIPALISFEVHE